MIDKVSLKIKKDQLICEFGDRLLERYESNASKDSHVSQKMRELGRFVFAAKSLDHKYEIIPLTQEVIKKLLKSTEEEAKEKLLEGPNPTVHKTLSECLF